MLTTPLWRETRLRRVAGWLAYPVFFVLNRPSLAWFGRAIYDFALRCNGVAINFKGRDGLNQGEERFLRSVAGQLQGGVLLDVGANCGDYARFLARLAPNAEIHAFEPHPRTAARLRAACPPGIRVVEQALSDTPGTARLHDFADADGSTQASLSQDAVRLFSDDTQAFDVAVTTLDAYLDTKGITEVAFLKVDTEGLDLAVLRGAHRAIEARRIQLIQFEFIPANVATGATMRAFYEALPGYDLARICVNGALLPLGAYDVKRCEIYVTQNLVARPRTT